MPTPRSLSKSLTPLPPIESNSRPKSRDETVTMVTQMPTQSNLHLPPIKDKSTANKNKSGDSRQELLKQYEDLLEETIKNASLIKEKEKELEEQEKELDIMLKKAEEETSATEELRRELAIATKMLKDLELENTRMIARKSEQGLKVSLLEERNRYMHEELRNMVAKVNDIEKVIESGSDHIKDETERYLHLAEELKQENDALNSELKYKADKLNNLKIGLVTKYKDSNNTYVKNNAEENRMAVNWKIINNSKSTPDKPNDNTQLRGIHNRNTEVKCPSTRQREQCSKIPRTIQRRVNPHNVLPAIKSEKKVTRPAKSSDVSRNISSRGTSSTSGKTFQPKPPVTSPPSTMTTRRRRMKKY